jgi:dipeptidyl aminopeptidase/acylaminoacyl peptidase
MRLSALFVCALLCACAGRAPVTASDQTEIVKSLAESQGVPGLGSPRRLEPGVLFYEVSLPRAGQTSKLWVYLPERADAPKLPCVLIAPAGSNLFTGKSLGEGDRPEHLPYVRAGFAVVSYELDGALASGQKLTNRSLLAAFNSFREAQAGVANARMAIDYILAKIPQIDPERIYTAGHSSAATLSLLVAEHEPRVKACIAYAPATDIEAHLGAHDVDLLATVLPGFRDFIREYSPLAAVSQLRCPLFIFNADDDSVVPPEQSARFAAEVSKVNPNVTYVRVPTGNHYDSMIKEGVPRGISWLKAQQARADRRN